MAKLTTCGTCGHQVSVNATQCPNCGAKFKKKTSIFTWAIAGLIGVPFLFGIFKGASNEQPVQTPQQIISSSPNTPSTTVAESNWEYDVDTDKMRGTKTYFAGTASKNSANFQFPYQGESHLHIMLRNKGEGNDVMFSIDKGQFHCSYDGCEISVKFDNEAITTYSVNEADAGKNDVVFLASNEDAFIKKLKTAKKVIIEAPFFQEPRTQFDFDTAGLEWKH